MKMMLNSLLVSGLLACGSVAYAECACKSPEPYRSVVMLPATIGGLVDNEQQLEDALGDTKAKTVIEIGSGVGNTTIFLADLLGKNGKLYAVDTWYSRNSQLYQQFLSNVSAAKKHTAVVPMRMTHLEAIQSLNVKADLIFINLSMDMDGLAKAIRAWVPHLVPGGVLCGIGASDNSIRTNVDRVAQELGMTLVVDGNFWRID